MPVNSDNHCEANSGFSGGNGDREDYDHHAGWWMRWRSETPERDEIQVCRSEHHLDADQNENGVTAAQCSEKPDRKQRRGNNEEELKCWCHGLAEVTKVKTVTWLKRGIAASPM